jgi:hypothetical protein
VQKRLTLIAVQRRIEEERLGLQRAIHMLTSSRETVVRAHTQETMEVDAPASVAGNGGVKRNREEQDATGKDSPSERTNTVRNLHIRRLSYQSLLRRGASSAR